MLLFFEFQPLLHSACCDHQGYDHELPAWSLPHCKKDELAARYEPTPSIINATD